MEISYGKHPIIHADKISDDEVKEIEIIHLYEDKKITVQKRTIKNKTYNSYLLGIPDTAINIVIDEFIKNEDNKQGCTILEKIDNKAYKLLITDELKPEMIKLDKIEYYDIKNKTYKTTLPKKKIECLQAYDRYLETLDYINNKYDKNFKAANINALIIINFAPVNDEMLQKEVLIKFYTNIDDKFINAVELLDDKIPDWLDLLTAIPKKGYLPSTFY